MADPVPYEEICDAEDRSWTERLLDRLVLPDLLTAERDEIVRTLVCLEDPRAAPPLTRILAARELPEAAREAAGAILRSSGNAPSSAWLRAAWAEGDRVLRRHALLSMGRAEADIVEPIARDPAHPFHGDAIAAMVHDFAEPRFLEPRIAALGHPDPGVRKIAADALVVDEPLAAEAPLLRAAGDPVVDVAVAALLALLYYPSRRCLIRVVALCDHPDETVRGTAASCAAVLREGSFRRALDTASQAERRFLLAWMDPVRHLLDLSREREALPPPVAAPNESLDSDPDPSAGDDLAVDELIALYAELDGPWAEKKLWFRDRFTAARGAADRGRLIPFLTGHPDPWIRGGAADLLAAWDEREALLGLTRDPAFTVRKSAMYWLGQASPDRSLAARAWEHLADPATTGTHASETLATWVRHAPAEESISRLVALARSDAREHVRYTAVRSLAELHARTAIEGLTPLLAEPPSVTWALHVALLDACWRLRLNPGRCDGLRDADNVDVQLALARCLAGDGARG